MINIGLYLPVYGGWLTPHISEEEEPPTYRYIRKVANEAERIGITSLWLPDHLLNTIKGRHAPTLESWTLATAITGVTEKVIIASILCEAFCHPAVLAKQITTLNEISNGRFWPVIGAGGFQYEFEAFGLPFHEHNERIVRAKEVIQIMKRLWEEDNVTFKGKYYQIQGVL